MQWRQSPFGREELSARAYYAAIGTNREEDFDRALFQAAWIQGQDVNDEGVIRHTARSVGLNADHLLQRALDEEAEQAAQEALNTFDRDQIPGVPTWVVNEKRFWGKDRVEWMVQEVKQLLGKRC